jgi:hypothetical protein
LIREIFRKFKCYFSSLRKKSRQKKASCHEPSGFA